MTTTQTISRERLEHYSALPTQPFGDGAEVFMYEVRQMARMLLATMNGEPKTDDELANLLWYAKEAACHPDPNYGCEFQRLAAPGVIAGIVRELQEYRLNTMDSEPVAWQYRVYTPSVGGWSLWHPGTGDEYERSYTVERRALYAAPPAPVAVPDEQHSERFEWTYEDWANHLGGRHQNNDPACYYEFGSFLAVAEMLRQFGNVQRKVGWNACRAAMLKGDKS